MEHNRSKGIQDSQNKSEEVSRRRFLRRGSLATGLTVLASAFSLVPFSPAHAAATTSPDIPQVTKMGGHEANLYLQQMLNKAAKLMRLIRQPDERDQEQPPCHERRRIQLP